MSLTVSKYINLIAIGMVFIIFFLYVSMYKPEPKPKYTLSELICKVDSLETMFDDLVCDMEEIDSSLVRHEFFISQILGFVEQQQEFNVAVDGHLDILDGGEIKSR